MSCSWCFRGQALNFNKPLGVSRTLSTQETVKVPPKHAAPTQLISDETRNVSVLLEASIEGRGITYSEYRHMTRVLSKDASNSGGFLG